ncbi:MAG: hypothetical protein O3A29_03595 [Planctomycetota bacterium]|nr:hypothetical protein [Planctomycetota bacterium]
MPVTPKRTALTPPELAAQWGVKAESIIAKIRAGQLRAFDVSLQPGVGRPRYRISLDAIVEYEKRFTGAVVKTTRAQRKTPDDLIEYFK